MHQLVSVRNLKFYGSNLKGEDILKGEDRKNKGQKKRPLRASFLTFSF